MAELYCGFDKCIPFKTVGMALMDIMQNFRQDEHIVQKLLDPKNPAFDLPSKVLFPHTAADVVDVVSFAEHNSFELYVKNSGHNYTGASTKSGTLLLNMHEFWVYSDSNVYDISGCDAEKTDVIKDDLRNQSCVLAKERGKAGYARVSRGKNWSDVSLAVRGDNERLVKDDPA